MSQTFWIKSPVDRPDKLFSGIINEPHTPPIINYLYYYYIYYLHVSTEHDIVSIYYLKIIITYKVYNNA